MLINAISSLVQPLFNKGQNRANLRIAKARQEQALVAFNQALLVAGAELSDALTACQLSNERLKLRTDEIAAAQQTLLQSRLALASDKFDQIQGIINLFKALGGYN